MAGELPQGFELYRAPGVRVVARRGFSEAALALSAPAALRGGGAARGRAAFVELQCSPFAGTVAVRHYFRGGVLGGLLGDLYPGFGRALRELVLYEEARRRGVETLEPLAVVGRRAAGVLWRLDLITRAVGGTRDLRELYATELAVAPARRRAAVLGAAGRAVRRLHDAGLEHDDLNLGNLLVAEGGGQGAPRVLVIDLDRARLHRGTVPQGARLRNLVRLYRSAIKLGRGWARPPARTDLVRFARAYAGGDRALLRRLVAAVRRYTPWLRVRRLVWGRD